MIPVPIPDEFLWEGAVRKVISSPDGDLTGDIRPVEALIDRRGFFIRLALEDGDFEKLKKNPHVWLGIHADRLPVFSITLEEGGTE